MRRGFIVTYGQRGGITLEHIKIIFNGLGIEADPLDWYYKIMDRKERKKHGSRRS